MHVSSGTCCLKTLCFNLLYCVNLCDTFGGSCVQHVSYDCMMTCIAEGNVASVWLF